LEAKATITLRQIGGNWKGDKSNITGVELTNQGQAALEASNAATAQAASNLATATSAALQAKLGGTLVYVLDDGQSVGVVKPDGGVANIQIGGQESIELIDFAPDGSGFYFAERIHQAYRIRFYNLDSQEISFIRRFEDTIIQSMAVSPENTKLAIATEDTTWIIPASESEDQQKIWEGSLMSLTWAPDSKSVYAVIPPPPGENVPLQIVNLQLDGNKTDVEDLPLQDVTGHNVISLSPNSQDIAFGGGSLGLLSLSRGSKTPLAEITPVCNPTGSFGSQGVDKKKRSNPSKSSQRR
jgi:hypothetical protein